MDVKVMEYYPDVSTLRLKLSDDSEYSVAHPHHAQSLYKRLEVGRSLTDEQLHWLAKYRVTERERNRERLRGILTTLRKELK
jgi:hypothetical protein